MALRPVREPYFDSTLASGGDDESTARTGRAAGEQQDRVPYVDVGIEFPFAYRLLEREVPGDRFFDSGEYESTPIELQLDVKALLRRDNLTYHMAQTIPAHKVPG